MRVLVTGATGFLGGHLTATLCTAGHAVVATGRKRDAGAKLTACGAAFAPADLSDARAVDALVMGMDAVVHCGGLSSAWGTVEAFRTANVTGTANIVAACERHGVKRLVHISTPGIYFDFTHRLDIGENDPLPATPVNLYAASKREAETLVAAAAVRGLDAIVLRPRGIFGPGDTALLPRLLRVSRRGWLPLLDGGHAVIDLTYVGNVVDAILASLAAPARTGLRIYNITNGEPLPVRSLFEAILERFEIKARLLHMPFRLALAAASAMEKFALMRPGQPEPLLTRYSVGILGRSQTLSLAAARRDLDYAPRIALRDGFAITAEHWRAGRA